MAVLHLRALVDAGDLAVADDVAEIGDDLRAEGDEKPDRIDALEAIPDALEASDLAEREERGQGERRSRDEEDRGFSPRAVDLASRLDVQITQVRILR
ncbi:MAG: hypothetical protein KGI93_12840 [Acidobacteriota bacterium]|nr:hypothetical protein [Acidobacteriota bacterium]